MPTNEYTTRSPDAGYLSFLPPDAEVGLQELADTILTTYINGNKSDARRMMREVPPRRVAYVTMWIMAKADRLHEQAEATRLIYSVTE